MSLEDNAKELAELKARLAALEPPKAPPRKPKTGCATYLLTALGVMVGIGIIGTIVAGNTPPPPAGENLKTAEMSCDEAWATKVWSAAGRAGLVRGQQLQGVDLIVMVSPFGWNQLSLDAQRNIGLAAACQLGHAFEAVTVHFRYDANGSDTLKLTNIDIYSLALGRFVPTPSGPAPIGFRASVWGAAPVPGLRPLTGGAVWVTDTKPHPAFLSAVPSDEDYEFEHRRLVGGDLFFEGAPTYALLKTAMRKSFGDPSTASGTDDTDNYLWAWRAEKVSVALTFDKAKASAMVHLQKDK